MFVVFLLKLHVWSFKRSGFEDHKLQCHLTPTMHTFLGMVSRLILLIQPPSKDDAERLVKLFGEKANKRT